MDSFLGDEIASLCRVAFVHKKRKCSIVSRHSGMSANLELSFFRWVLGCKSNILFLWDLRTNVSLLLWTHVQLCVAESTEWAHNKETAWKLNFRVSLHSGSLPCITFALSTNIRVYRQIDRQEKHRYYWSDRLFENDRADKIWTGTKGCAYFTWTFSPTADSILGQAFALNK